MSGKPWFRARPELRDEVIEVSRELQPELFFVVEDEVAYLRGTYLVVYEGEVWDRYKVEIEFPHNYQNGLPTVRETAGRIPREPDRHMEPNGRACLFLKDEFWWHHPEGLTFRQFLGETIHSYFVCQTYYDQCEETWLLEDREHHAFGRYCFYKDAIDTDDLGVILRYLDYIERGAKGHWGCPCGSGERLRDCHRDLMWKLKDRIPPEVAARSQERLRKWGRQIARELKRREAAQS